MLFHCKYGCITPDIRYPLVSYLNSEGYEYNLYYIHDEEISAARWLNNHDDPTKSIATDYYGWRRLVYGGVGSGRVSTNSLFEKNKKITGYLYLRYYNVVSGKLLDSSYGIHELGDYHISLC